MTYTQYKDRGQESKLFFGPLWDLNLAFGSSYFYGSFLPDGWQVWSHLEYETGEKKTIPWWWRRFLTDYCFVSKVIYRWQELRKGKLSTATLLSTIDGIVASIPVEEIKRNAASYRYSDYRWSNTLPILGNHAAYVARIKKFLTTRLEWMDRNIFFLTPVPPKPCTFSPPSSSSDPVFNATSPAPTVTFTPSCVELVYRTPDESWFPTVDNYTNYLNNTKLLFAPYTLVPEANNSYSLSVSLVGGVKRCLIAYSLTSIKYPNGRGRDPFSWRLLGSNDKANWTVVDARTNVVFTSDFDTRKFVIGRRDVNIDESVSSFTVRTPSATSCSNGSFAHYKILVTANRSNFTASTLFSYLRFYGASNESSAECFASQQTEPELEPVLGIRGLYYEKPSYGWSGTKYNVSSLVASRIDPNIDFYDKPLLWPSNTTVFPTDISIRWIGWLRVDSRLGFDNIFNFYLHNNADATASYYTYVGDLALKNFVTTPSLKGGYYFVDLKMEWKNVTSPAAIKVAFNADFNSGQLPIPKGYFTPAEVDCDGITVLDAERGRLTLPFKGDVLYGRNEKCGWLLRSGNPNVTYIRVNVLRFNTEQTFDTLQIYSIKTSLAPLELITKNASLPSSFDTSHPSFGTPITLSGDLATQKSFIVEGSSIFLLFKSDQGLEYEGFEVSYEPAVPYDCKRLNDCNSNGQCNELGLCACSAGFTGDDCSEMFNCRALNNCSGHGRCTRNSFCTCDDGYFGVDCTTQFDCSALNNCYGRGICVSNGVCQCQGSAAGLACDQTCEPLGVNITSVLASGSNADKGEGPEQAADGNPSTKWLQFVSGGVTNSYLAFHYPIDVNARSYVLVTANDYPVRDPYRW